MKLRLGLLLFVALLPVVQAQHPRVVLTQPTNGTTFSSNLISLLAEVTDQEGVLVEVKFFVDGIYFGSAFQPPYELPVLLSNGRHAIRALATNNLGYVTWSTRSYCQIGGDYPVGLIRGPYLQSLSATSVVVRWRTDWPTNSLVCFGQGAPGAVCVTNNVRTNEHEVLLTELTPNTVYEYGIGSGTETFSIGAELAFRTAPTNMRPVAVWVIGDSGKANTNAEAVKAAYVDFLGPANTDLWLMLGDNAYESGTDDEYQAAVFDIYREILGRVPLWPTLGNHDAESVGAPGEFPYLDIFTLPAHGESGGVPSGTEKFYSFDYANIHFICLDSHSSLRAEDGPMLSWLKNDLSATDKDWIVAFWHHPPYTKGSHNSDGDIPLVEMRERALPILESYGVDLVLCGHSHVYERSYLMNGHYGFSTSLTPSMILDSTLGDTEAHPYRKPAGGLGAGCGTIYAVCGCSGEGGPMSFLFGTNHPVMARNFPNHGSMILYVDGLQMRAGFLRPSGVIDDSFIIDKSQPTSLRPELQIAWTVAGAELSWPTSLPVYSLQGGMAATTNFLWQDMMASVKRAGRRNVVTVPFDETNRFFRLRSP